MKKKHWLDTYAVVEDLLQRRCWGTFFFASLLILGRSALIGGGIAGAGYLIGNSPNIRNIQTSQLSSSQSSQNGASSQVFLGGDAKLPISANGDLGGVVAGDTTENGDFKESDWDLNTSVIKQKETGFYCVKERKGFEGGEIWYHEKLKIGEVVKIRFSLKPDESVKDAKQSPKLVILYGRKEDKSSVYRMFFPDVDTNFVVFESTAFEKKQTLASHLPQPLDVSGAKEIELEYSVESLHSNDAIFHYNLSYVPFSDDGKQVTGDDSFQNSFPSQNAKNAEQEFGLGAFPGTCFRIISFGKESR